MVQNSRETPSPSTLRPLNLPAPITVEEDAQHQPSVLFLSKQGRSKQRQKLKVASIDSQWRIDEEWWREKPIIRMYYQLTTEDSQRITIFRDLTDGQWYRQKG